MTALLARLSTPAAALALAAGMLVATPQPASATVTRLCTGYSACARAGMGSDGYAGANGTMYWRMYAGHNCTNYAAYRMIRSGLPNVRPWDGGGNATYWGTSMAEITDDVPRVGAVAWWKAGVSPAGSAGHVAYVEEVVSDTEIVVSQDAWGGDFSWARITRTTSGWPSGFVHFNDERLQSTAAPTVTGPAEVGSTLTATTGSWSPADVTAQYRWRAGGERLRGQTGPTLSVGEGLVGKRVRVRVLATRTGYPLARAVSDPTEPVRGGSLEQVSAPAVLGAARVDETLTVTGGVWSPTPTTSDYQWAIAGADVVGATGPSFTPGPDAVGQPVAVRVTVSRSGYSSRAMTLPVGTVGAATMTRDGDPVLSGRARAGRTLRLGLPAVSPDATPAVTWLRGGVPVPGAGGTTYALTAADVGRRVVARVTWQRPGYDDLTARTPRTERISPAG